MCVLCVQEFPRARAAASDDTDTVIIPLSVATAATDDVGIRGGGGGEVLATVRLVSALHTSISVPSTGDACANTAMRNRLRVIVTGILSDTALL